MTDWYPIGMRLVARDLWVTVPLDWNEPEGETIRVFAREVVSAANRDADLPLLVFLQGGPGGKSPRPLDADGWIGDAVTKFRVILPDQRGTGRSTPLGAGDFDGLDAAAGARLLALHRQDSIVRDFEALREAHFPGRQWWTLGQSYGGFLTLQYLSHFPESIVASAITGGLPSIDPDPEVVYSRTFPRIAEKNRQFRERHPHLVERIARVADLLEREDVRLPGGDRLTVRRLQTLGLDFGMKPGFDRVHWIFDEAFVDEAETRLSEVFLATVEAETAFLTNPLFIALQEAIYGPGPSAWAAQRERESRPEFAESASRSTSPARPCSRGCSRKSRGSRASGRRSSTSPPTSSRSQCTTTIGSPATRCPSKPPSTTTTCMLTPSSRSTPRRACAACTPG